MPVDLTAIVMFTGMFGMIFGIAYLRNRENMSLIERGLNPRNKDVRPRPFLNLKWGLLLIGSGTGLLLAYIIDNTIIKHDKTGSDHHASITSGDHHHSGNIKTIIVADSNRIGKDTALTLKDPDKADKDGDEQSHIVTDFRSNSTDDTPAIYCALIAIGGGLGLFFSYRIEKKEWLDKKIID